MIGRNALLPRLGPWIKPLLHRYWVAARGMTLGVRCAAFDADGRIFLVRHTYVPGWHFPGGGVEIGETVFDAVEKELLEEANIVLNQPADLFGFYYNGRSFRRDHVALFVTRDWRQPEPPTANVEIAEHGWFDLSALPEETTAATIRRIEEIASGSLPAKDW